MGLERPLEKENGAVEIREALDAFYGSADFSHLELNSQNCYRRDLDGFFEFLKQENITHLPQITQGHTVNYLESLGLSDASIARQKSSLRKFFKWAVANALISPDAEDIPFKIKYPKDIAPLEHLTSDAQRELIAKSGKNLRNRALVLILLRTGARITECLKLNIEDVSVENQLVSIKFPERSKTQELSPFDEEESAMIKEYLEGLPEKGPLFTRARSRTYDPYSYGGNRLTRGGAWIVIKELGRKIGRANLTPRTLRYTYLMDHEKSVEGLTEDLGISRFTAQKLLARKKWRKSNLKLPKFLNRSF